MKRLKKHQPRRKTKTRIEASVSKMKSNQPYNEPYDKIIFESPPLPKKSNTKNNKMILILILIFSIIPGDFSPLWRRPARRGTVCRRTCGCDGRWSLREKWKIPSRRWPGRGPRIRRGPNRGRSGTYRTLPRQLWSRWSSWRCESWRQTPGRPVRIRLPCRPRASCSPTPAIKA